MTVLVERDGGVGRIVISAPERLNAVDAPMLDAIAGAAVDLGEDDRITVVVLTGAGERGFCTGAALGELGALPATDTLESAERAVLALRDCPKPVIALVNGVAAGVGVSLALVCDYVLAPERAAFMLAFTKIGLMPDGGATALVAASIGRARALRLALTAEKLPAATAAEWGLIAECVPDEEFDERAASLIASFSAGAPLALAASAAAINAATLDLEGALARESDGQNRLLQSQDCAEGVAAFLEKRAPRFTGR